MSSDDDSDISSDEEYLTTSAAAGGGSNRDKGGGEADREALVRKKLLENFYGKSAVAAAAPATRSADESSDEDDSDDDDSHTDKKKKSGTKAAAAASTDDLDSPAFDAAAHTRQAVVHGSVHELLQQEEQLALQVRTLDSTMQTLVYENYTRFIDATDAIKSIGVHVQQHEADLRRLTTAVAAVDEKSKSVEDAVGALRDQVAEKIRTSRLLSRLDALLQLPTTLQRLQRDGKYPQAVAAFYPQAASILAKHVASFESLKAIETECREILSDMQQQLQRKLLHWSGVDVVGLGGSNSQGFTMPQEHDDYMADDDVNAAAAAAAAGNDDEADGVPDPPKTMTEIFECVGALLLLWKQQQSQPASQGEEGQEEKMETPQQQFSVQDLQSMASAAALRFLDRTLDAHVIQVSERRFGGASSSALMMGDPLGGGGLAPSGSGELSAASGGTGEQPGAALVASEFLTALLQGATLFADTFATTVTATANDDEDESSSSHYQYWMELIQEAFASFLVHTRSILLEESAQLQQQGDDAGVEGGGGPTPSGGGYAEISAALGLLVQHVQMLADGLEAIVVSTAGGTQQHNLQLVQQVQALTKSMVRRRVDQKFHALRLAIVQDCLVPFVQEQASAAATAGPSANSSRPQESITTRVVSSTLSNCLQLVDDTIRSILAGDLGVSNASDGGTSADPSAHMAMSSSSLPNAVPDLKDAVQASTKKFAYWLANTMELLAGGESSDRVADAPNVSSEDERQQDGAATSPAKRFDNNDDMMMATNTTGDDLSADMMIPGDQDDEQIWDKLDTAVALIAAAAERNEQEDSGVQETDFILAICEMCRMAQTSVSVNLEQSIASHIGSKRKSRGLFPSGGAAGGAGGESSSSSSTRAALGQPSDDISKRFELAESRVIVLYAGYRGSQAADLLGLSLTELAALPPDTEDAVTNPPHPTDPTLLALGIVKMACIEVASVYGGEKRAGPVAPVEDDRGRSLLAGGLTSSSALTGRKTALQLDVERMFKEKVQIYPHPSQALQVSRNAAVFLLLKIAFRAMFEQARLLWFSPAAYRQVQIDTELLKHMISHYIDESFQPGGTAASTTLANLLDDVLDVVGERCEDATIIETRDAMVGSALQHIRSFLSDTESDLNKGFVIEED